MNAQNEAVEPSIIGKTSGSLRTLHEGRDCGLCGQHSHPSKVSSASLTLSKCVLVALPAWTNAKEEAGSLALQSCSRVDMWQEGQLSKANLVAFAFLVGYKPTIRLAGDLEQEEEQSTQKAHRPSALRCKRKSSPLHKGVDFVPPFLYSTDSISLNLTCILQIARAVCDDFSWTTRAPSNSKPSLERPWPPGSIWKPATSVSRFPNWNTVSS